MTEELQTYDDVRKIGRSPKSIRRRWLIELELAEKRDKESKTKIRRALKRYHAESSTTKKNAYNILYSNVAILHPSIFNTLPRPECRRRFDEDDPVGQKGAEVLNRALSFSLDEGNMYPVLDNAVLDYLLIGRPIVRVRYVPTMQDMAYGDVSEGDTQEVEWEQVVAENVAWDKFRHGPGKRWEELEWVAFLHEFRRDELAEQFGESVSKECKMDAKLDSDKEHKEEDDELFSTCPVWEVWDKQSKTVVFVSENYQPGPLSVKQDPLGLTGFFPMPRPPVFVADSTTLEVQPPYEMYREQAEELDRISQRINRIIDGCKLRGIYDSRLVEMVELLRGDDNDLIPAENVRQMIESGGLQNAIWFLPLETLATILAQLYVQREQVKQVIYDITGISDIRRGNTDPNETLGAQELKSQSFGLRIGAHQRAFQNFARDILELMSEIIAEKFSLQTIQAMTGMELPTMQDKMLVSIKAAQTGQPMQQMPPTWEEVMTLLQNNLLREFKINVETDSTIEQVLQADMVALSQVLDAVGTLMERAGPLVIQGIIPMDAVKQLSLAICRRARLGTVVEDALDSIEQPPPQAPDQSMEMEEKKAQAETMVKEKQMELDEKRAQAETMVKERELEIGFQKTQLEHEREVQKAQVDTEIAARQAEFTSDIEQMKIKANAEIETLRMEFDRQMKEKELEQNMEIERMKVAAQLKIAVMSNVTARAGLQAQEGPSPEDDEPPVPERAAEREVERERHQELLEQVKMLSNANDIRDSIKASATQNSLAMQAAMTSQMEQMSEVIRASAENTARTQEVISRLAIEVARPKSKRLVYDDGGKPIGVEEV